MVVRTEKGFPKPDGELIERQALFSVAATMVFESPEKSGWAKMVMLQPMRLMRT